MTSFRIGFAEAVTAGSNLATERGAATLLYVGGAGNVSIQSKGAAIAFTAPNVGTWHRMPPFTMVNSTGTTATELVAGWED